MCSISISLGSGPCICGTCQSNNESTSIKSRYLRNSWNSWNFRSACYRISWNCRNFRYFWYESSGWCYSCGGIIECLLGWAGDIIVVFGVLSGSLVEGFDKSTSRFVGVGQSIEFEEVSIDVGDSGLEGSGNSGGIRYSILKSGQIGLCSGQCILRGLHLRFSERL